MNAEKLKERGLIFNDEQRFRFYFIVDPSKFREAVKPNIVKTVTTDFEGNATFESVPEGNYYIYGLTECVFRPIVSTHSGSL